MRKSIGAVILILGGASVATALPSGLSCLGVGGGGLFGDGSAGFVQGEFDFGIPPYVSLGPEVGVAFGGGTVLIVGAEGRVYFIPTYNFIIQPHAVFGGGVGINFDGDDGTDVGGYMQFGGGMDFEIPNNPMAPYFDMGALIGFGDGTDTAFKLEGGIRFDLW